LPEDGSQRALLEFLVIRDRKSEFWRCISPEDDVTADPPRDDEAGVLKATNNFLA
jgi:hypothetical protein